MLATINTLNLVQDALQVVDCRNNQRLGQLLALKPLNTVLEIFSFSDEMQKVVKIMSKMRNSWQEFVELCDCILERHYTATKSFDVQIAKKEGKEEIQSCLEKIFGKDIQINFIINSGIKWGFIIHAHHLGLLYDYTRQSLANSIQHKLTSMMENLHG